MTPYVANDKDNATVVKKPRSIMVHPNANGNQTEDCVQVSTTGEPLNGEATLLHDESSDGDSIKPLLNGRNKSLTNGNRTKAGALKRVSFGSSKGSMVETLVYDHNDDLIFPHLHQHQHQQIQVPLLPHGVTNFYPQGQHHFHHVGHTATSTPTTTQPQLSDRLNPINGDLNGGHINGHDDNNTNNQVNGHCHPEELNILNLEWQFLGPDELVQCEEEGGVLVPSRVKVSFFECQKPTFVTSPESPDIPLDFLNISVMSNSPNQNDYQRQHSTDSGLDNPFRPDGELSREADTIVSLIKEGKPITPVKSEPDGGGYFPTEEVDGQAVKEAAISPAKAKNVENAVNNKVGANGNAPHHVNDKRGQLQPGVVEVQHGIVVPPSDASQVEQVVIKKKPKCKCCVIQ